MSTVIIGLILLGLFALAFSRIRKKGVCQGGCEGCKGSCPSGRSHDGKC